MRLADLHPPEVIEELNKNKEAYAAVKDEMEAEHWGRVVLLHAGEVVHIYNDLGDAYDIGCEKYGAGHFSLQRVGDRPIDLRFQGAVLTVTT